MRIALGSLQLVKCNMAMEYCNEEGLVCPLSPTYPSIASSKTASPFYKEAEAVSISGHILKNHYKALPLETEDHLGHAI